MDFGRVLDDWDDIKKKDHGKAKHPNKGRELHAWLDRYPPGDKDASHDSTQSGSESPGEGRRRLRQMAPQATLDLHGFNSTEALAEIDFFLANSVKKGLRKVLIIHGKGRHSKQGEVLKSLVADALSTHPLAGENALSARESGGSGARWVILRQRSR